MRRVFVGDVCALQAVLLLCIYGGVASGAMADTGAMRGRQLQSTKGLKLPLVLPAKFVVGPASATALNSNESTPQQSTTIKLPGLPAGGLHRVVQAVQHARKQQQVLYSSGSSSSAAPGSGLESRAISVGFAANGGKTSAHAVAHVQQPATGGAVAVLANATAVANHASQAVAKSNSGASNMAHQGTTMAQTAAEALADHSSTATADSLSRAMGLGGLSTSAGTTTRAAATGGSRSNVAGTAVSSAVGHDSSAHVTSDSTGAAKQHSTSNTRADSITIAVDGSTATGSATSTASSQKHGTALSQSLMESFSLFNSSHTDANSLATVHGSSGGTAWSRDKAVGIGLWSSTAATNTTSQVVATKLGLAVVTSVVRSITAQGRLACADAIRKAAAELATGPQINFNDVSLHLGGKVPQKCLASYKDLTDKALRKAQTQPGGRAVDVKSFEQIAAGINAGMAPGLQAAQSKVHQVLHGLSKKQP